MYVTDIDAAILPLQLPPVTMLIVPHESCLMKPALLLVSVLTMMGYLAELHNCALAGCYYQPNLIACHP